MLSPRIGPLLAVCLLSVTGAFSEEPESPPGPSLGVALSGSTIPDVLRAQDPSRPIEVRVVADWGVVESEAGVFDWSSVAPTLSDLATRGTRITLCLKWESRLYGEHDGGLLELPNAEWLDAWTKLLRSAVAELGPNLAAIEIGEAPETKFDSRAYAFVLKASSLAVKSEAKTHGLNLRVAQGAVGAEALEWQKELWQNDAAPYVDILPISFSSPADVPSGIAQFASEAAQHPPAPEIRAHVAADEADPWSSFRGAVAALASSASSALVTLPGEPERAEVVARELANLQARLADGYAPAPAGGLALRRPEGGAIEGAAVIGRFLRAKDFATVVVYQAPLTEVPDDQARLLLDTIDVKDPAIVDLLSGASYPTGPAAVPGEKARALRLLLADHPMAAVWERAAENQLGLDVKAEDVDVATTRGLTAEEIIARNREGQRFQDDHLLRWISKGRADLHYKFAQGGGSIDVAIESAYFWRRGAQLEWRQTRYYVNGNRVTWKRIPELPLIQPEKVATLPLDLTFDKTYDYTLSGEDTIDGRDAYVVAFEPSAANSGKTLYRGRVWIDKQSFVRLRTSVLQTNLEPPILQNEENGIYRPVSAPSGESFVLIARTDGQQLWSGGGRNFVVRRELALSDFEINPTEERFDELLKEAYASDDQMLRDTDVGFRYLEKQPDGSRTVQEGLATDAIAALAGVLKDDAIDGVLPAIGFNWFDADFLRKKLQVNVFFAGVYAFLNLTDPSVAGTKVDLGAEASLFAIKFDDTLFVNGTEDISQRVETRPENVSGRLGYPLGNFFKLAVIGDLTWFAFDESFEAREALAGTNLSFVLPDDHQVYAGTLQLEFNRIGYSVTASGTAARRSKWERWGLYDNQTASFLDASFDPDQKSFARWKLTTFKEWYLPRFQKLKLGLDYVDGKNLDRFSQYQFSRFGDTGLVGFSGTGVRFDTGAIGRTGWAFNIASVIRFDAAVEFARVRDSLQDDRFRDHLGAGFSFNVVGPWMTVWQGSYGRAISSDVPELEGKQEFAITVLKLFPRGLKRKRSR